MFSIVSTGPLSLAIDPTYDRKVLDEAIKKITGNGLKPSDIIQGADTADGPAEVRYRAHVAFSTAYDMLRQLERITNRRKAVVWVSNGYDFNPFAESRMGEDPVFGGRYGQSREEGQQMNQQFNQGQQFADADLARELAEVTRTANRANSTLYTIDPRGWWPARTSTSSWIRWIRQLRAQDTGQPAGPRRRDRRHRGRQPERFHESVEADRRRDQRLLRAGLLLLESRSVEADAEGGGQGHPAEPQ